MGWHAGLAGDTDTILASAAGQVVALKMVCHKLMAEALFCQAFPPREVVAEGAKP